MNESRESTATPGGGAGYRLAFGIEGGTLRVASHGVIDTLATTLAYFRDIAQELRRRQARSLLIVDSTDGVVPDAKEFETLAASLKDEGFDGIRIAFVDAKGTAIGRIEVGEIIARRHGYRFRVFDSEPLAKVWLRYGRD